MEKKRFLFYTSWKKNIDIMDDVELRRFINNLINYTDGNEIELLTKIDNIVWNDAVELLNHNETKRQKTIERNRVNGKYGGRPPKPNETQDNPVGFKETQNNPVGFSETHNNPTEPTETRREKREERREIREERREIREESKEKKEERRGISEKSKMISFCNSILPSDWGEYLNKNNVDDTILKYVDDEFSDEVVDRLFDYLSYIKNS
jgi:hypothetical protein